MNIDMKLADKRHDQVKNFFFDWHGRLGDLQKRADDQAASEQPAVSDATQNIQTKLKHTEEKLKEYQQKELDGWNEITDVIEGLFTEIEDLFKSRQPIKK